MANVDFVISGGVTDTSAIVASKLSYSLPASESQLRVLRLDYDGANYKVTVNGNLISSIVKTGNWSFINNLMIGSDGDSVAFLRGYIPEILIYKNMLSTTDAQNVERWLADKWLDINTSFSDYSIQASEGVFPTVSNQKFLHFDETGLVVSSGKVTQWNDKANFNGVTKVGIPIVTANQAPYETNKFKGKSVAKFDGNANFKVAGLNSSQDPDFATIFVVYRIDNFDFSDDQVILGDVNDAGTAFNNAIRIKKYTTDDSLSCRFTTSSGTNRNVAIFVDRNNAFTNGVPSNIFIAKQRLKYSTSSNFTSPLFTSYDNTGTGTNGVKKFNLTGLTENTTYYYQVELDDVIQTEIVGQFKTFKIEEALSFNFVAGSCNYSNQDCLTWEEIANEDISIFIHMGDFHYDDISGNNQQLFRDSFSNNARQNGMKNLLALVPFDYVYDDHDYGANNSDSTSPSRPAVINFYKETIPSYPLDNPDVNGIYHAYTIGRVRFIHTDMRSNRTPFLSMDKNDPAKTMLGATQKAWFKQQLIDAKNNTNIALIVWLNPSPWTGDDTNPYSWDYGAAGEHWTTYLAEREEIHQYIIDNDITNIMIINGDTHQLGIDDGRNSVFAKDENGNTYDWKTLNPNILTPVIESSPFNKDVDNGSGPFDINDKGDSGKVVPMSEKTYSVFRVSDNGYNWIKVDVEQYCLPDGISYYSDKTLVNKFSFIRDCNGISHYKPELENKLVKSITGKLTITNTNEPVTQRQISFINPTSFKNNWKAPIQGRVINTTLNNHIVRVYRRSDVDYLVSGDLAVDNTTGDFTFSGSFGISQLVFKLFDNTGNLIYTHVNSDNQDTYSDLRLDLYYVTDIPYLIRSMDLKVGSSYTFPDIDSNAKSYLNLVRKSTNQILSKTRLKGELPRSYIVEPNQSGYGTPFASKSYLYDASLALIALSKNTVKKNTCIEIAKGIVNSQLPNGAFPFSTNHVSPDSADAYIRNGGTAWTAYGLAYFLKENPLIENKDIYLTSLTDCLSYLISQRNFTTQHGLIRGGSGRYEGDIFNPSYQITWVSTEHNIDAYFAFKKAYDVTGNASYLTIANDISSAIQSYLYDGSTRMYQGLSADGSPDTSDALDINSWGSMFWSAIGRSDVAGILLNRAEQYYFCYDEVNSAKGYKPYSASLGYPSAKDTVWFEGSFGVALAYYKLGNIAKYKQILNELELFRESDGSFRYATLRDDIYEISDKKSLCSTCWSIMVKEYPDLFWS